MLSSPIIVTPPMIEPISLAAAKSFLKVDGDASDADIAMMLAAARGDLEDATGQRLITQTVKVLADRFAALDHLTVGPIQSVTGITYQDPAGNVQTLPADEYELFGGGIDVGIRPRAGTTWPSVRTVAGAISVTLTVGYGDTGAAVKQNLLWAVYALLRGKFDNVPVSIEQLIVNERINP